MRFSITRECLKLGGLIVIYEVVFIDRGKNWSRWWHLTKLRLIGHILRHKGLVSCRRQFIEGQNEVGVWRLDHSKQMYTDVGCSSQVEIKRFLKIGWVWRAALNRSKDLPRNYSSFTWVSYIIIHSFISTKQVCNCSDV